MIIKSVADAGAMGILSDRDIMESLMTGYIGISDFSERGLTPNGYDLRIAEISVRGDPEIKREGTVTIPPRTMFYVSTIERVRMASDICAQLWLRTTWIRKGVIGAFGKIDAGFEGTLTLGAYNGRPGGDPHRREILPDGDGDPELGDHQGLLPAQRELPGPDRSHARSFEEVRTSLMGR